MRRRIIVFCAFAFISACVFLRLGFWQIGRLRERQAFNAMVMSQKLASNTPILSLPNDTAAAHYRGASAQGRYDYEHELILAPRTRNGSPGVDFITPMRIAGTDTAVLVNRGWVYSPDAASVDRAEWRELDTASVTGYVELYNQSTYSTPSTNPRIVRVMNREALQAKLPYPIAPYYLVSTADTANAAHPVRRTLPPIDDGPHGGYALQWFSFAVIALVGAGIVVYRERAQGTGPSVVR